MATESQRQLRAKLDRYWRCYNESGLATFPLTVWIAVDAERDKELRWLIAQMPADAQVIFRVATVETLPTLLMA